MSDAPVTRDARPRHQDGLHIAAPPSQIDRHGGGAATLQLANDCLPPIQAPDPGADSPRASTRLASLQRQNGARAPRPQLPRRGPRKAASGGLVVVLIRNWFTWLAAYCTSSLRDTLPSHVILYAYAANPAVRPWEA